MDARAMQMAARQDRVLSNALDHIGLERKGSNFA
jgi:hypothetical protein